MVSWRIRLIFSRIEVLPLRKLLVTKLYLRQTGYIFSLSHKTPAASERKRTDSEGDPVALTRSEPVKRYESGCEYKTTRFHIVAYRYSMFPLISTAWWCSTVLTAIVSPLLIIFIFASILAIPYTVKF
eukprot:scaffold51973_cov42-Attheya_sp.AAC.1